MENSDTQKIGFFLIDEFSMIAFASAIEPLRAANRLYGKKLYSWRLISEDGGSVLCSNGVKIDTHLSLNDPLDFNIFFLCGGLDIKNKSNKKLFSCLRKLSRNGVKIGAICTATYLLAKASLLKDRKCTIHWENSLSIHEEFPDLKITNNLFEVDKDRFTCSGGTAALDMILHLIAISYGASLSKKVSDLLIHNNIRQSNESQRMDLRSRLGVSHPKLISTVEKMENNLEEPLSQVELSKIANLSMRQLERLFKKYLFATPTKFYLNLRLVKSRQLLLQTSMSVLSIALASGFVSASHFSKCYKAYFGRSPRLERSLNNHY